MGRAPDVRRAPDPDQIAEVDELAPRYRRPPDAARDASTESAMNDPRSTLQALRTEHRRHAREHAELKARVAEYTTRRFLSPGEQLELRTLQRMKLLAKDRMHDVERRLSALEARELVS
jgi:hypothetical protein